MKLKYLKGFALLIVLLWTTLLYAQGNATKDVFVLIDVSGTMNNGNINNEARQQMYELLTGNYEKEKWAQKGWAIPENYDCNLFESKACVIVPGSKVCVMPFGNMDRMTERKKIEVSDIPQFETIFNESFPKVYKDGYTYLTLAKAYVASVAQSWDISQAYIIVYSDGLGDVQTTTKLRGIYQELIDAYEKEGGNTYGKIGILRKSTSVRNYDIEVFNFSTPKSKVPLDTIGKNDTTIVKKKVLPFSSIRIKNKKAKSSPMSVKVGTEVVVSWLGSGQANVSIQKNEKQLVGKTLSDNVDIQRMGNSVKLTFSEAGSYKISVSDADSSDSTYVEVSSPFPWFIIVVIIAIVGGIFAIRKFMPQKRSRNGGGGDNGSGDDW